MMEVNNSANHVVATNSYVRERISPQRGEPYYLPLSDLKVAIDRIATGEKLRILDFGCGGSPYRSLFPNSEYYRADIEGTPQVDFVVKMESCELSVPPKSIDLVVSSQVLEHVPNPGGYLAECRRVLRSGGRLFLTTHGTYPDHACPNDFYRWTCDGLMQELLRAGFQVEETWKLTTGPRAVMHILELYSAQISSSSRIGLAMLPFKWIAAHRRWWLHRWCDRQFPNHRVVVEGTDEDSIYIGVGAVAVAP